VKRKTLHGATPIGVNTMFLQKVGAINHFQRFANFSHITNNLGLRGGKVFFAKSKMVPFQSKKNAQRPNTRTRPVHC
jgi:hypothetical protein